MRLDDKVAVVTGAGSGFGAGIAARFATEGARVVAADINGDAAARIADDIRNAGGTALAVTADVSKGDDMARIVAAALDEFGALDVLVNNAGTTHKNRPMLEVDEDTYDRVFAVNVKSVYHSAIHAVPVFRRQGHGNFINIASTAGLRPRPGLTWYAATKGAVITMTKSMAVELAPDNIRANAINPVVSATGLLTDFLPGPDTPEARARFVATIPLGRMSTPRDVAAACLFLASEDAEFLTGVCLEVDGGRCI
ncbi:MAG: SDR family oxidoreductase [Gammaproteobacteria bacterium]|nr:MAG: SDR family oxidoreductase [Gammaproteobacteria bacterium]